MVRRFAIADLLASLVNGSVAQSRAASNVVTNVCVEPVSVCVEPVATSTSSLLRSK